MVTFFPSVTLSTRKGFGDALVKLGEKHKRIVVLDADVGNSTYTNQFEKTFPERFFNFGVAEQNMVGAASGFALRGKIPFAVSFAMFVAGRAWEQARNSVSYSRANVKLVGSHGGILVGEDGATHQALEDIATMRSIANMKVFQPADYFEAKKVTEAMVLDFGPSYLRLGRSNFPFLYDESYHWEIGKGSVLFEGTDVGIIASGAPVHFALEAAKMLKNDGISARVINMCSIKPIDTELIADSARKCSALVTVEDHNVNGGLGSAVSEVLCETVPKKLLRHGMHDFGESGKWQDLYKKYKLDAKGIYEVIKTWRKSVV